MLIGSAKDHQGIKVLSVKLKDMDTKSAKTLAHNIQGALGESVILLDSKIRAKLQ